MSMTTPDSADLALVTQRMADVEAELAALRDERAIRELLAEYGYLADACQAETISISGGTTRFWTCRWAPRR
jgi:ethanolamine utilization protein EutA (predicted chaperonin)